MTETGNPPDHTVQPERGERASAEYKGIAANDTIPLLGYVCLCLNLFLFGYLFVVDPLTWTEIRREDRWVEDLTAVWFLLTGLLLFAAALFERSLFRRCTYFLGGILMVFIAGEEISWGQRIFDFETPDVLLGLNRQGEFNVHNIDATLTGNLFRYAALMLCTITAAAFFRRKDALLGFPLPSLLTLFGFLIAMAYAPSADPAEVRRPFEFFDLTVTFSNGRTLLLLFCLYFMFSRQVQWLAISVASMTIVLVFLYVHEPSSVYHGVGREIELQEYLFGIVCLFYALELLARRWAAVRTGSTRTPTSSTPSRSRFLRSDLAGVYVCPLVILCSVGLALLSLASTRAEVANARETYRLIASGAYGEPVGRSTWDVYLVENRLVYFKEPCRGADRAPWFFLHVAPVHEDDLPDHRRQDGFDNLNFYFGVRSLGVTLGESCIRTAPLPDYAISSIETGQFAGENKLWEVEFSPPRAFGQ